MTTKEQAEKMLEAATDLTWSQGFAGDLQDAIRNAIPLAELLEVARAADYLLPRIRVHSCESGFSMVHSLRNALAALKAKGVEL